MPDAYQPLRYGPGDNCHLENAHVIPALIRRFHEARQKDCPEVIVWGTGRYANEIIKNSFLFKKSKVAFFVDSSYKKNIRFIENKVFEPEKVLNTSDPILIASSTYWQEIYRKILELGVNKSRVINTLVI